MARRRKEAAPGRFRFQFREDGIDWLQDSGFVYYHNVGWCNHDQWWKAQVEFNGTITRPWVVTIWSAANLPPRDSAHIHRRIK